MNFIRYKASFLIVPVVLFWVFVVTAFGATTSREPGTITVTPSGSEAGARTFAIALVCESESGREQGLQGFRQLRADEAALFVFEKPEVVTFWMGTVTYPIDIVFVGPKGTVVGVAPDCRPGSSAFYGSGVPVAWVVETAAGSGIMPGDRIAITRQGP